jgi:hypothetical protein
LNPPRNKPNAFFGPPEPEPAVRGKPSSPTVYLGGEAHFIVGSGIVRVSCCDERAAKRIFWFRKICIGAAVGFSAGGGVVAGLSGENCRGVNYEGWFLETGVSAGPIDIGADIGYRDLPGSALGPLPPLPGDLSGVVEGGGSKGLGLEAKATWCYYKLYYERHEQNGCACPKK